MNSRRLAIIGLSLLFIAVGGVHAQATTATLKGSVTDSDGVGLPGVPVTVSSRTHGVAQKTVLTDMEGRFKFQLLPPANDYTLSINYPGFAPVRIPDIDLDPGRTTVQPITLHAAGDLTTEIEVIATGDTVDTDTTVSSTNIGREYIESLPIIGQNFQSILTLAPTVTDTDGDGNPNVQGERETNNQFLLDGSNTTDPATGTFGQNLNLDAIEEIEIITAGASAEFGRASGGFFNVITKSGGNDFEGSARLVWRGKILDGDGATGNQDTFVQRSRLDADLRDVRPFLTLGGSIRKDKLWYFASLQRVDLSVPLSLAGASITTESRGWNNFAKLTWQVNSDNKVALQHTMDPRDFTGLFVNFGTSPDSDALFSQGGNTTSLRWTSIVSPVLLLETLLTRFDSGIAVTPVSDQFHETTLVTRVNRNNGRVTLQSLYPTAECSTNGEASGFIPNCSPALAPAGAISIFQIDLINGTTTGPFPTRTDDLRTRNSIKSDLTFTVEDAWGEHQIKSGIQFDDEKFEDSPINNPFFINIYEPCTECRDANGQPVQNAVTGRQILTAPTPTVIDQRAVSFNSSAYVNDVWKPKPNLTIQVGLRLDRENVDTAGFTYFNPRDEKRRAIGLLESLCADGLRVAGSGGAGSLDTAQRVCGVHGRIPGTLVGGNLIYTMDGETPERLRRLDANQDGLFDSGADGQPWLDAYTVFPDRLPENFNVTNLNLAPRFSISWDPFADGKTKVFSTWGRFYDRLFLNTVSGEIGPDNVNYSFVPDPGTFQFEADQISQNVSAVSVAQVDRNITTPFTDVFTLGFERELAPEWSARVTFTQRLGWNLLQDVDRNHILCSEFESEFGIDPSRVCPGFTDARGTVHLSEDLFGSASRTSNGAPDLYNVNANFNQILRVGNYNNSRFRGLTFELNKRLHRNWQMQTSYTYSRALGQAEAFGQALGNDPSTRDDEEGFLAFDQRHRVVLIATSHLPRDVELGTTLTWTSGTPFSIQSQTIDQDDAGNTTFRTFFPTRQRNDQRNGGFWGVDAKIVKRFLMGSFQASAELSVQNLLNHDDLTLAAFRPSSINGVALQQGPQGLRRFGRFWELGLSINF